MKLTEVFVSNYLNADDLSTDSHEFAIESISQEDVVGEEKASDFKLVLYLAKQKKGFVCNKTNAFLIAGIYGEETDNWLGLPLVLRNETVLFKGEKKAGIRVHWSHPLMKKAGSQLEKDLAKELKARQ